jgi:hypothetical protein
MEGKMEPALLDPLTWKDLVWLGGLIFTISLSIYAIWQFIKIIMKEE